MKKLFIFSILVLSASSVWAQIKFPGLDKSPMDMSYCPDGYPSQTPGEAKLAPLVARIIYGRPQKNGRVIFGGLVPYGQVWRLGANEATEIDFFVPVKIDGKSIEKGRYTLYAIPDSAKWTLVLNKKTDTWGAYSYDSTKDLLRVNVPVKKMGDSVDALSILFNKTETGSDLVIAWDQVEVALPIHY